MLTVNFSCSHNQIKTEPVKPEWERPLDNVLKRMTQPFKRMWYPWRPPLIYDYVFFFNQRSITEAGRVPLTHQKGGERQDKETGARNLIHLVFIWPSKTTPRSIAIQSATHIRVFVCVCLVNAGMCMSVSCRFPCKPELYLWAWIMAV